MKIREYIIQHMESLLKYLGTAFLPLSGVLLTLWGFLEYEWMQPCWAIVALIAAPICFIIGILCFYAAFRLVRARERREQNPVIF